MRLAKTGVTLQILVCSSVNDYGASSLWLAVGRPSFHHGREMMVEREKNLEGHIK